MMLKDDWVLEGTPGKTESDWTYSPTEANAVATQVNANTADAVYYVAAPSGDSSGSTDTAALQAAHDGLPAGGGELRLRAGIYYLTSGGVTFTKKVQLIGVGPAGPDASALTLLVSNSLTATAITVNVEGCVLDNFAVVNNASGTRTAGAAIRMQKAHLARLSNLYIFNFYDAIKVEAGHYWSIRGSMIMGPTRYGLFLANSDNADSGDNVVDGVKFDTYDRAATAAIRWETGGGLRIVNCKVNANGANKYATGFDFAYTGGIDTANIFVQNSSIENVTGSGVKMARSSGSNAIYGVMVQGNEFQACATAVEVGVGVNDVLVSGNYGYGLTTGVTVGAAGPVTIGVNRWRTTTTPVNLSADVSSGTTVAPQQRVGDGIVVSNTSTGVAVIESSYSRCVDFTVSTTPAALFGVGVPNYGGGIIEMTVAGLHSNVGGFVAARRVGFIVNGSGVVTLTDLDTVAHGSTGVLITFATSANDVVAKVATTDGNTVIHGTADLKVYGLLTQIRIGA